MARQYTGPSNSFAAIDIYFPIGTVLELIFYVGLLKVRPLATRQTCYCRGNELNPFFMPQVAEQMKNPFGEDDEDFDLNYLLNRHMKVV